jgi:hypothetical protein
MEAYVSPAESGKPVAPVVDAVVKLRQVKPAAVDLDRVPEILGGSEAPWLGARMPDPHRPTGEPSVRYFLCDLEVRSGAGQLSILRKSAIVGFGPPSREGAGWVVPVEWRAATMAPLFPVFAGRLLIDADQVVLEGGYAPPFGRLGVVLDAALLRLAARATARWFLNRVGTALA